MSVRALGLKLADAIGRSASRENRTDEVEFVAASVCGGDVALIASCFEALTFSGSLADLRTSLAPSIGVVRSPEGTFGKSSAMTELLLLTLPPPSLVERSSSFQTMTVARMGASYVRKIYRHREKRTR